MFDGRWIWANKRSVENEYTEYLVNIKCDKKNNYKIKLSYDTVMALYVNDTIVTSRICADYPNYKMYDIVELNDFIIDGDNKIIIQVWSYGIDTQTNAKNIGLLIFDIYENDSIIAYSSKHTLSRTINQYKTEDVHYITSQLGRSYYYDARKEDLEFSESYEIEYPKEIYSRNLKTLFLNAPLIGKVVFEDSNSIVVDLGKESSGYLNFELNSIEDQELIISYSESLGKDNHTRRLIGSRDFSIKYYAVKGYNKFSNYLRRISGRYLEISFTKKITLKQLTLRESGYPVDEKTYILNDEIENKIYQTCLNTLKLCMHEHYEDSPWREQGFYTMDSRNEMLCSYFAFNETNYQKQNILLISKCSKKYGLLDICYPCGGDLRIPSFSLAYIIQVYEYIKYTNDYSILDEVKDTLDMIVNRFLEQIDETGLLRTFDPPMWNFYEWSLYMSHGEEVIATTHIDDHHLFINAYFIYVIKMYNELTNNHIDTTGIKKAINSLLYNSEKRMYRVSLNDKDQYSSLANAICILADVNDNPKDLCEVIINDKSLIPTTISMKGYVYDALLKTDINYKDYVLNDIYNDYTFMLNQGATSFFETIKGEADFDGAGSLCHGWSTMPIYFYHLLKK